MRICRTTGELVGADSPEVHNKHTREHALLSDLRLLAGAPDGRAAEQERQRRAEGDTRYVHGPRVHVLHLSGHCEPGALRHHGRADQLCREVQSHAGRPDTADALAHQVPEH